MLISTPHPESTNNPQPPLKYLMEWLTGYISYLHYGSECDERHNALPHRLSLPPAEIVFNSSEVVT